MKWVICLVGVIIIALGGLAVIDHRGKALKALEAEHLIRKSALLEARIERTDLLTREWRYAADLMGAGASSQLAHAMVDRDFAERRTDIRAKVQRVEAALDAFYLAHPEYRGR